MLFLTRSLGFITGHDNGRRREGVEDERALSTTENRIQIAGFNYTTNVFLAGSPIRTAWGRVTMLNPPFNPTDTYNHAVGNMVTSIEDMGTFETTIQVVSLSSSTTLSAGDVVIAYAGSLSNGTGDLANVFGLVWGGGTSNIFTGEGNIKEVIRARFEF